MGKELKLTLDLDEDLRNQDWLKRQDELSVQDIVTANLKKKREERKQRENLANQNKEG